MHVRSNGDQCHLRSRGDELARRHQPTASLSSSSPRTKHGGGAFDESPRPAPCPGAYGVWAIDLDKGGLCRRQATTTIREHLALQRKIERRPRSSTPPSKAIGCVPSPETRFGKRTAATKTASPTAAAKRYHLKTPSASSMSSAIAQVDETSDVMLIQPLPAISSYVIHTIRNPDACPLAVRLPPMEPGDKVAAAVVLGFQK